MAEAAEVKETTKDDDAASDAGSEDLEAESSGSEDEEEEEEEGEGEGEEEGEAPADEQMAEGGQAVPTPAVGPVSDHKQEKPHDTPAADVMVH